MQGKSTCRCQRRRWNGADANKRPPFCGARAANRVSRRDPLKAELREEPLIDPRALRSPMRLAASSESHQGPYGTLAAAQGTWVDTCPGRAAVRQANFCIPPLARPDLDAGAPMKRRLLPAFWRYSITSSVLADRQAGRPRSPRRHHHPASRDVALRQRLWPRR